MKGGQGEQFIRNLPLAEDNCIEWPYTRIWNGYGRFKMRGRHVLAHRASYEIHVGDIPDGCFVLHSCDNRACVNPKHLSAGSHQQNMQDRGDKNRAATGEHSGRAKLTDAIVHTARERHRAGASALQLANEHGVGSKTMWNAIHGRTWRHVDA